MGTANIIISSYNQPQSLRLVLEGLARQDCVDFEVIIADDGSRPETFEMLDRFACRAVFRIRIVTQPDKGFRKARALNSAVRIAKADRLIFLDGDTLPFPNFVRVHRELEDPLAYGVGGYAELSLRESRELGCRDIVTGDYVRLLTAERRKRLATIHRKNLLYSLLGKRRKPKILGGNFSVSRDALYGINGFDERFDGRSGEDSDVRNRLNNLGASGKSLWNRAFVFHLDHQLDPVRCQPSAIRMRRDVGLMLRNRSCVQTDCGLDRRW